MGSFAPVQSKLMGKRSARFADVSVTNAYGTTEGGTVVVGAHPKGRRSRNVPSVSASESRIRLVAGDNRDAASTACWKSNDGAHKGYPPATDVTTAGPLTDLSHRRLSRRGIGDGLHYFVAAATTC